MEIKTYKTSTVPLSRAAESKLKKFESEIVNGHLEKWFSKRCNPPSEYSSFDDFEKSDHKLFLEYMDLRIAALEIVLHGKSRKATELGFEDGAVFDYLNSLSYQKDLRDFEIFQAKRREEWNDESSKSLGEEVAADKPLPEPDTQESLPQSKLKLKPERGVNRVENVLQELMPEQSHVQEPEMKKNVQIPTVPFPAFKLLQDAYNKKQEEYDLLKTAHNLALENLHQMETSVTDAENAVRVFDDEKERYMYSGTRMPPEMFEKIKEANEKIIEANKKRKEAAQLFFDLRTKMYEKLQGELFFSSEVVPQESPRKKKYVKMSQEETFSLLKSLNKAVFNKNGLVEILLRAVRDNATDFNSMETVLKMIAGGQFEGIEKFLPKKMELVIPGEIEKVKIAKLVSLLIKSDKEVKELESKFKALSPEDQIKFSDEYHVALEKTIEKKEKQLELYNKQLDSRKKVSRKMECELGTLETESLYARAREYKSRIENANCDKLDKNTLKHRDKLFQILKSVMESEGINDRTEGFHRVLDVYYAKARGIGSTTPYESVSGVKHDPLTLEIYASESRNSIVAQKQGGWQYRVPEKLLGDAILGNFSKYRYSCRLVADKDMIDTLDGLATKYKFQYKVPDKTKHWGRVDTVTMYCKEKLSSIDEQEIAKAIQSFVFKGDDALLLGRAVTDDHGNQYIGIRADETPDLPEIVHEIEKSFELDKEFGKIVASRFSIAEFANRVNFSASPGIVAGLKNLISDIVS